MESVLQNIVPQAGILNKEENPAIDSDRVKASVVDASSTDFGGSQKHDVANLADAEEVDRLAPTASKKMSEEEEDNQTSAEAVAFRALRTKAKSLVDLVRNSPSYGRAQSLRKLSASIKTGQVRCRPFSRKGK